MDVRRKSESDQREKGNQKVGEKREPDMEERHRVRESRKSGMKCKSKWIHSGI
jgi:hypothetical protein